MKSSSRRIDDLLWVVGLSRLKTPLTELLEGRASLTRRIRSFYAPLLKPGALVFDIGANNGGLTRVFASLGARVVAVEPNPDCALHIERTCPRTRVEVLQAAAGQTNGLAVLKVSDRKDKMSSLSDEWREAVSCENKGYVGLWQRELTVPMIRVDDLIKRFGMPDYIKVDVEGYEDEVLYGLSQAPDLLSFEFNRVFLKPALHALDQPIFLGAKFNYTLVDPVRFASREWMTKDEMRNKLERLGENEPGLGDIFVRRES